MSKLLLVEDDPSVREPLQEHLQKRGFQILGCATLADARRIDLNTVDLIILDWELSDGHGVDFLRDLRAGGAALPVILLTARTDLMDKVVGLELGADDYITKPFQIEEVVARVRARLRSKQQAPTNKLESFGVSMDLVYRRVQFQGKDVELTKMEFNLLKFFLENPQRPLGRDEILNRVWGFESFPNSRTVDTHVRILRQKLDANLFETLHGIGYRFGPST